MIQIHNRNCARNPFLVSFLTLIVLAPATRAWPAQDAAALQKQAIERVERCVAQMRKTGNVQSVLEEMRRSEDELTRSYQEFNKQQNWAAAALSLNKLADLQRFQSRWQPANEIYRQAYQLANRANHTGYKAKALLGQARVAYIGLKDYDGAITALDEALKLPEQQLAKRDLFDIYDLKSAALSSRGEAELPGRGLFRRVQRQRRFD